MKFAASTCVLLLRASTCSAFAGPQAFKTTTSSSFAHLASRSISKSTTARMSKPFSVIVEAEINPDHMNEFMGMIETNAVNSRKEPGCLRFDVLRAQDNPNKFFFYEVYENSAAVDFHKTQDHYKAWADFKEKGVISSVSKKADGEFMT